MSKMAEFKAKYGVSHRLMAGLFGTNISKAREWTEETPQDIEDGLNRLDVFAKHLIKEGELLRDQVPLIQVLEHDLEMCKHELSGSVSAQNRLKNKLETIEGMGFIQKIKFVLKRKSH